MANLGLQEQHEKTSQEVVPPQSTDPAGLADQASKIAGAGTPETEEEEEEEEEDDDDE